MLKSKETAMKAKGTARKKQIIAFPSRTGLA